MLRAICFVSTLVLFILVGHSFDSVRTEAIAKGKSATKHSCTYVVHGSKAEGELNARRDRAKGGKGGGKGGGGGGGGKKPACAKTFALWSTTVINVFIDDTDRPDTIPDRTPPVLEDYTKKSFDEWACHSGLGDGELIEINYVTSAMGADITVGWGNLGGAGILGQAATSYIGGVIISSTITMNSNQSAFSWTEGITPTFDVDGCADEVANGIGNSYDLLSVVLHEVGHALGIAHSTKRCRLGHDCYNETMFPCTGPAEYSRRALNAGDKSAISTNYGSN